MASTAALVWICSLAVLSSAATEDETLHANCSSDSGIWRRLSADFKVAAECGDDLPPAQEQAALLLSMRNLTASLLQHQLDACRAAEPKKCPTPQVPDNGGLLCFTVANKRYCKPMCNYGYDFSFLRLSRLFEECSEQSRYKWSTQYVGGNRLAECKEASLQIAGAASAYFPKDCLTTKSMGPLKGGIMETVAAELKKAGIEGEVEFECLLCG